MKYRSRNAWVGGICGLCLSVTPHAATAQFDDDFVPDLTHIATYHSGIFDEGAAEIAAYDADLARVYFTNGDSASIDVLDVSDPTNPVLVDSVSGLGESVNSVAVSGGVVAVAVEGDGVDVAGEVAFLDAVTLDEITRVPAGFLPDMLTFTPDGSKVVVANEGEPNDSYTIDPEGSVTIIDVALALDGMGAAAATQVSFAKFNDQKEALRARGVRIFGPEATVAQDLEPEYVGVTEDSTLAYVALQENNALAVIDLMAGEALDILPLGYKDYSRDLPLSLWEYPFSNDVLASQSIGTFADGTEAPLGGLSGLFYEGMTPEGNWRFVTHPDRGPDAGSGDIDGQRTRIFTLPDLQPAFYRFEVNPEGGEIEFVEKIALKLADGTPLTGLPNIAGDDGGRQGQDVDGNLLPYDPYGADLEGVVVAPDGSFWACDEYRPAIYHFSADGTLIDRFVPNVEADLAGSKTLPGWYDSARDNRGFEAIALDTETGILYAFIQTPLGYDGAGAYNADVSGASSHIRILGIDPATGEPVAEYAYFLEKPAFSEGNVDKVGDATFIGDGKFYVIERDSGTSFESNKVVYEIDLAGATDLLTVPTPRIVGGDAFEMKTADELVEMGIRPVSKREIINLAGLGYLPSDKPEGIAVLEDGSIAVLNDNDFEPESKDTVLGVVRFEYENSIDANDEDETYVPTKLPVLGMYQPDAISVFTDWLGDTYIITANEGDAREYEDEPWFIEEAKLDDLQEAGMLDLNNDDVADSLTDEPFASLNVEAQMSELNITAVDGDIDGDGMIEQLYTYGARSFSIFDIYGNLIFDSGDDFEFYTAEILGDDFNSTNDENGSGDSRSDNKGPEPEAVDVGWIGDSLYAFIGLERVGGVMVYDVTFGWDPIYIGYFNNRDFSVEFEDPTPDVLAQVGDLGPESVTFVPWWESPTSEPMLIVANEVSGTISLVSAAPVFDEIEIDIGVEGSFQTGIFDESAAEIASFDPIRQRLFVTNADTDGIDILDVSDPMNPVLFHQVTDLGGSVNSVDVHRSVAAIALAADETDGNGKWSSSPPRP